MQNGLFNIATSSSDSITLLDLQRMVRSSLEERFSEPMWISAEISELKLNRSGHCYLNLVEKGTTDGAPRAEARAVIWKSTYKPIASMFEAATGRALCAGLRILVRVVVSYHEIYGFSLQIIDLDPRFTLGEVERRRRETIARLQSDGVWDMNRELSLPRPTLRIAIVSSDTAAGYQDFINELHRSPYRFSTTLFKSLMQGDMAEESIIAALESIAERMDEFDVVAIIRGGGSTSNLALFDSYRIASHVAQFPLPVFSGIGHDKDTSVVDLVAHSSLKTPTAVATLLVEMADTEYNFLYNAAADISTIVERRLSNEAIRIMHLNAELERLTTDIVNNNTSHIDSLMTAILNRTELILHSEAQRITDAERILGSYSTDNILRIGFAVLRSGNAIISSAARSSIGDNIEIEMHDGTIGAEIKTISLKQ